MNAHHDVGSAVLTARTARNLAAIAGVTLTLTLAAAPAAAWAAGPGSTGVGIQADDICLARPAQPGTSNPLGNLTISNPGSGEETITITVGPPPPPAPLHPPLSAFTRHAIPVPPSWVSVRYPPRLGVITQHSITLTSGQTASVPVTLNVPATAKPAQYQSVLTATTSASPASGNGIQAATGAGAATYLKFSVGTGITPPGCAPPSYAGPWWALPSSLDPGFRPPPGWSLGGPAGLARQGIRTIWTYIPPAGTPPPAAAGGVPPRWDPRTQMQVWTMGGEQLVLDHLPGFRYLPGYGPFGVIEYQPARGKLPAWAVQLAAGQDVTIPGYGQVTSTAPAGTQPGQQPASYAAPAATVSSPAAAYALIAGLAGIALIGLARRRR